MQDRRSYVGRFAPTPSGPLHFGSIITALASYLQAKTSNGQWLLRIDDLDTPRIKPGATDTILSALETLGLVWQGEIIFQSHRSDAYQTALHTLQRQGLLYKCYCTRKQIGNRRYPGTCRNRTGSIDKQFSLRLITRPEPVGIYDCIQGDYYQNLEQEVGDFIVDRADGIAAYHLAVAVDDAWQGVTDIVRGADLLDSTPKQVYLQGLLGISTPGYSHIPVAMDSRGKKISKRFGAVDALLEKNPAALLVEALNFLGQQAAPGLEKSTPADVISWAMENWDFSGIPRVREIKLKREKG